MTTAHDSPSVDALRFVVTGSASGIGKRVTDEIARRGGRVLATDVNADALASAAGAWPSSRVRTAELDVRDAGAWQRAFHVAGDAFGGVDVLMNIAGYLRPGYVHEVADEDVDRHFDINAKGLVLGTRAAARHMRPRGSGHIVNIASLAGIAPVPGISLYSASKHAVRGFSIAAAIELAPHGVAVTVVCPDAVDTPMLDGQRAFEEAAMTFTAPRVLSAEEVASLLLGRVLRERPIELAIPAGRRWLAQLASLAPELARLLHDRMRKQGLSRQRRGAGSGR